MRIFGADQGVRMTLFPEHVGKRRGRRKRSVVARVGGWVRGLFGRRESKGGGK